MTAEPEEADASQSAGNHPRFAISLPEIVREHDQVATRPIKPLGLVDFLTSEGFTNLSVSVFLEALLLSSWR
jgi:hypothetical protein